MDMQVLRVGDSLTQYGNLMTNYLPLGAYHLLLSIFEIFSELIFVSAREPAIRTPRAVYDYN